MEEEERRCRENQLALERKKCDEEGHMQLLHEKEMPTLQKPLNPGALPFFPGQTTQISESAHRMECFIPFMARRELLSNKNEKFDNHPENYTIWRAAFRNMTREVNITASQELSLMIEHSTGESKRLVQPFCKPHYITCTLNYVKLVFAN